MQFNVTEGELLTFHHATIEWPIIGFGLGDGVLADNDSCYDASR